MLSRYNTTTDSWQEKAAQDKSESEGDTDPEPNETGAIDCVSHELGNDDTHHQETNASDGENEPAATDAIAALCGSLELRERRRSPISTVGDTVPCLLLRRRDLVHGRQPPLGSTQVDHGRYGKWSPGRRSHG